MNVQWQKLLVKTTLWLVAEIWLNFLGIDDVADYSEFIFERQGYFILDLDNEFTRFQL